MNPQYLERLLTYISHHRTAQQRLGLPLEPQVLLIQILPQAPLFLLNQVIPRQEADQLRA